MKRSGKRALRNGILWLMLFAALTLCLKTVDVQPAGQTGTDIGFSSLNTGFHELTGIHMKLYLITDWLGLVPVLICMAFGGYGLRQLIRRKHLFQVDADILLLGGYYVLVILCYVLFEKIPVNFRPVFIEGRLEASYPSSTTLLVLSVMPTLVFEVKRRMKDGSVKGIITFSADVFSAFMILGRLISGVHWLTDIVGAVFLSRGLFSLYQALAAFCMKEE